MFYCPTPQNSQDFQSKIPKIFNFEAVFPIYSSGVVIIPAGGPASLSRRRASSSPRREAARQGVRPLCLSPRAH